jgi:hypothetical protein
MDHRRAARRATLPERRLELRWQFRHRCHEHYEFSADAFSLCGAERGILEEQPRPDLRMDQSWFRFQLCFAKILSGLEINSLPHIRASPFAMNIVHAWLPSVARWDRKGCGTKSGSACCHDAKDVLSQPRLGGLHHRYDLAA